MPKTKEELNAIRKELEAAFEKLAELTEEELCQVTGGMERPSGVMPILLSLNGEGRPFIGNTQEIIDGIDDRSSQN